MLMIRGGDTLRIYEKAGKPAFFLLFSCQK